MFPARQGAIAHIWVFLMCTLTSVLAQSEEDLLKEFYKSTGGDDWLEKTGWDGDGGKICTWFGITCLELEDPLDPENEGVVGINLEGNNLYGVIPESFWTMPYLSQVRLGGNNINDASFTGFKPGKEAPITQIDLTENSIVSMKGIGGAPDSLRTLHLTNNRITGEIPMELFNLNMLRKLFLSFNEITGEIPSEVGKMDGLRELYFYGNWLSGFLPSELGLLDQLEVLTFAENQLSGVIPPELENMRNLRTFSLHNNDPDSGEHWGDLPHFEDLVFLTELYLDGNAFSGDIPSNLLLNSNVTDKPVTIGLSNNLLSGTLPGTLVKFDNLFIDVTGNELTGVAPRDCRQGKWMNGLVELYGCDAILCPAGTANSAGRRDSSENECVPCSGEYLSGDEDLLGQLYCPEDYDDDYYDDDDLQILMDLYFATGGPTQWDNADGWNYAFADVEEGDTVDDIPDDTYDTIDICGFYGVQCASNSFEEVSALFLGDNNLQGLLPENIFKLSKLERLDFGGNNVWFEDDDYGFGKIEDAPQLTFLNMSSSGVESWENINKASALEELYMTNSWVTGDLPEELFELETLKIFHCVFCGFEGELPEKISQLENLEELVLYGNELSGNIPSQIGELKELAILDLSENDFNGKVPEEINNCDNLIHFSVHQQTSDVGLSGPVPSFPSLTKIKTIDLSHNSLTGPIPNNFLEGMKQSDGGPAITVDLSDNRITGFGSSVTDFKEMNLILIDNEIKSQVPGDLCDGDHEQWMEGMVGAVRQNGASNACDAILCPLGKYNEDGRLTENNECRTCSSCQSLGCTFCEDGIKTNVEKAYDILNDLYTMTAGKNWFKNEKWLTPGVGICDYAGLTCKNGNAQDGVEEIDLEDAGLDGTVPTSIYELPGLKRLILTDNDIKLSFEGIEKATSLEMLHLSGTSIESMEFIGNAPDSLNELHLAQCDFEGDIPSELFTLSNLKKIFLNFNRFSGQLSGDIAQMTNLEEFWCFNNELTGTLPKELGDLSNLMVLALDENKLSGFLPTELEQISTLQKLNLSAQRSNKRIQGPLLSFNSNPNLDGLGLGGNALAGPIPSDFLDAMDHNREIKVDLSNNMLTGALPMSLDQFTKLDINLVANKIDQLDQAFCDNPEWMNGAVSQFGCDAILCPKDKFSPRGRQVDDSMFCKDCPEGETAPYMGSISCRDPDLSAERDILMKIYDALNGTNWIKQRKWNSDDPICTWYGVGCDNEDGDSGVTKLQLDNNNLEAVSSASDASALIFQLPELNLLDVKGNNFPIDFAAIGGATKLEHLLLSGTGLDNVDGIRQAQSLREVHLTDNELDGPIPGELFELTSLEELYISFNKLTGKLPAEITNWSQLQYLYAFNNELTGSIPSQIGELTFLKELVLGFNEFSGALPSEIENLVNLEQLSLINQQGIKKLYGPLPFFSAMPKLSFIDLEMNSFTGSIPAGFLRDQSATQDNVVINLSFNQLTGAIPDSLGKFSRLELDIVGNKFESIPQSLCGSGNSDWMNGMVGALNNQGIDGCNAIACPQGTYSESGRHDRSGACSNCDDLQFTPTIGNTECASASSEKSILMGIYAEANGDDWTWNDGWGSDEPLCNWDSIICGSGSEDDNEGVTALELDDNNLVGTVPSNVFLLPYLEKLDIKENPAVTISFDQISKAEKLELLYLSDIDLEDITGLGNAPALKELHLTDNDITGEIPDDFYNLAGTLRELYIAYNSFSGELSTKFGEFTGLRQFYAFDNNFSGAIPSEIGLLTNLQNLVLAENLLSGAIPDELGSLPNLQILSLYRRTKSGPKLFGPLPSFSQMPSLTDLYLDYNDLTGSIPPDFVSASSGTMLITLAYNFITGSVPIELATFEELDILLEGNKITELPEEFCGNQNWMDGDVFEYGCLAILCPKGYASAYGRQNSTESECEKCTDPQAAPFMGSTSCDVNLALSDGGEKAILELLYDSCGGDEWWDNALWKESDNACDWFGIECTERNTVRSIRLGSNNLVGTPPPEIFDLPDLTSLWLHSNPIQFSFEGIGRARHLTELRLDSIGLTAINGISSAQTLKVLDLRFNRLSGPFPSELLSLPNLKSLSLADNDLSGLLPTTFQGMPDINTIYLGSNEFSGPLPAFDDIEYLRVLDISNNKLTGEIPESFLASLPQNSKILVDLSTNQLTGSVPESIDRFNKLTIYLRDNLISALPNVLCDDDDGGMQEGDVGLFGCPAILCPPGTFNQLGRQSSPETPCIDCPDPIEYYGQTSCPSIDLSTRGKSAAESTMTGRIGTYTQLGVVTCSLFWFILDVLV